MGHRPAAKREADRLKLAEKLPAGATHREVARLLGVHPSTVTRDWQAIREDWRSRRADVVERWLLEKLAALDGMLVRALQELNKSADDAETLKYEPAIEEGAGKGKVAKTIEVLTERRVQGQNCNPRWMAEAARIIRLQAELLGVLRAQTEEAGKPLDLPAASEITTPEAAAEVLSRLGRHADMGKVLTYQRSRGGGGQT